MLSKNVQTCFVDVYDGVLNKVKKQRSELITALEEHIDFEILATLEFHRAFHAATG